RGRTTDLSAGGLLVGQPTSTLIYPAQRALKVARTEDGFDPMVEDWDLLIVLDACRFDAFRDAFSRYFEGGLRSVRSKGSCTPEWFRRTFTGRYPDVTYVSANPYINSLGIEVAGCNAREHFDRILDLWKSSWDPHLGTVTPDSVNRAILAELERGSDRRLIAHYIQPHAPYLSPRYFVTGFQRPQLDKGIVLTGTADSPENRILVKLTKKFVRLVGRLGLGTDLALRLRDALGLPPLSPLDATRRAHGVSGLRGGLSREPTGSDGIRRADALIPRRPEGCDNIRSRRVPRGGWNVLSSVRTRSPTPENRPLL
ncbi:MAG: hypothetical protein QI223_07830, partial [Candidatus Korarchaeota archaeon]|nr:hypothetical protein [Candidatus Korarchaeota archaeon]